MEKIHILKLKNFIDQNIQLIDYQLLYIQMKNLKKELQNCYLNTFKIVLINNFKK